MMAPVHGFALRTVFADALALSHRGTGARDRVVVTLVDLEDWQPWLSEAWTLLDASERERVARRRFAVDREQLVLGYALHRLLLGSVLARDPIDVPLVRDALGCPRLSDGSLYTSLSHANGCIAVAITATGVVGVDLEPAARAGVMPEIAERVCHPADAATIAGLAQAAHARALLALWVRKEALLKAAGVGLAREMTGFALPDDGLLPLSPPAQDMIQLRMLDVGPCWVAAVAGSPGTRVESAWLRPLVEAGGRIEMQAEAAHP